MILFQFDLLIENQKKEWKNQIQKKTLMLINNFKSKSNLHINKNIKA